MLATEMTVIIKSIKSVSFLTSHDDIVSSLYGKCLKDTRIKSKNCEKKATVDIDNAKFNVVNFV